MSERGQGGNELEQKRNRRVEVEVLKVSSSDPLRDTPSFL